MGSGADVFVDRPEQEDEQRLREALCKRRSVRICCYESPHGEAVDPPLRAFHTVSPRDWVNKLVDLTQPSGLYLVDETAYALLVRDERARLDASDRLAHVLLKVGEGLHGEVGLHAHLFVDLSFELVVGEGEHPAVGVVDEDDLARAEQALGDRQRTDLVVCNDPACVADDVRIALLQPEDLVHVEAGVHAGDHRNSPGRRQRQGPLIEGLGVGRVILEQLLLHAHRLLHLLCEALALDRSMMPIDAPLVNFGACERTQRSLQLRRTPLWRSSENGHSAKAPLRLGSSDWSLFLLLFLPAALALEPVLVLLAVGHGGTF